MMRYVALSLIWLTAAGAIPAAPGGHGSFSAPGPARGIAPPAYLPATNLRPGSYPPAGSRFFSRGIPARGYGGFYYGGTAPYWYDNSYGYGPGGFNDYYVNNNFLPLPLYPPQNFADPAPLPNDHPLTARLTLRIPVGAELTINGKKIDAGPNRAFESPELRPDELFVFDVQVAWIENGKRVEEKRELTMHAGDHQSLQYLATAAAPIKIERLEK